MRGTRTRDASVSSIPKPSHDDMILPAVARRIKEEGLFNHDVIAYSDDYNAPLYRLPTTPGTIGNPFASYDREKNTEGRQRVDLPEQEQYVRQQSPSSDRKGQVSENDTQALDVRGTMQGNDKANRQQRRRSKTMDQERCNVSNDFYADIQTAEAAQFVAPKKPAATRQQHENSSGYQKRQNQYPTNEGGDRYDQYDQQYSNNNNQGRQYRNEEPAQPSPRNRYDRKPQQAQDPYNYDHQQSQHQYQQYQQESKYALEPQYTQETQYAQEPQSAQRQQRRQKHYPQPEDQTQRQSHAQGGRSHYKQQQNYDVDQVQGYDNQDYEHRQPSRRHDNQPRFAQGATHIEMSQLGPEPQHDTLSNNNPEVIDGPKMKKKGAVCCIIS
ncbi:hypothetical protein BGZ82_010840 [Podila clonocystis]|nr:hypothetical protein BGZ82_010840 [Podila clonocystis]